MICDCTAAWSTAAAVYFAQRAEAALATQPQPLGSSTQPQAQPQQQQQPQQLDGTAHTPRALPLRRSFSAGVALALDFILCPFKRLCMPLQICICSYFRCQLCPCFFQ